MSNFKLRQDLPKEITAAAHAKRDIHIKAGEVLAICNNEVFVFSSSIFKTMYGADLATKTVEPKPKYAGRKGVPLKPSTGHTIPPSVMKSKPKGTHPANVSLKLLQEILRKPGVTARELGPLLGYNTTHIAAAVNTAAYDLLRRGMAIREQAYGTVHTDKNGRKFDRRMRLWRYFPTKNGERYVIQQRGKETHAVSGGGPQA